RKNLRGPGGGGVRNLFTGLVRDARDGTPMHVTEKRKGDVRMVSSGAMRAKEEGSRYVSFPFLAFERAVLSGLAEIDPREVLNGGGSPDEALALAGEVRGGEAEPGSAPALMAGD